MKILSSNVGQVVSLYHEEEYTLNMISGMKVKFKQIIVWLAVILVMGCTAIGGCYWYVEKVSEGRMYSSVKEVPANRVGVLLGTSPTSRYTKKRNPYYQFRIEATARLYKAGKIKRVLISGDNRYRNYNEPDMMKAELVALGIPAAHIYCDYAGFRTLDSMVRAKKVFGLSEFTVISQPFHNERALALAKWQGIDAIGYNARDIRLKKGLRVFAREVLARTKMVLDMAVNKQPHFLGERIEIK